MDWNAQTLKDFAEEMGTSTDEAAHMLVDMGEIDSSTHAELLSDSESERIYG